MMTKANMGNRQDHPYSKQGMLLFGAFQAHLRAIFFPLKAHNFPASISISFELIRVGICIQVIIRLRLIRGDFAIRQVNDEVLELGSHRNLQQIVQNNPAQAL